MAENKNFVINVNSEGDVNISEEVVAIIAGLGAIEAEGVDSLEGKLTAETISKAGMGRLSKAVRVIEEAPDKLAVRVAINIKYGYEIPKVCGQVQEKVKSAIETMTGIEVLSVDVRIVAVTMA